MEKISFALVLAGSLLVSLKSDALEKFRGGFLIAVGTLLFLVNHGSSAERSLDLLLLLALAFILFFALVLPYLSGVKNRNTEDLNDFDD